MESYEDSYNSLPYIDEVSTENETNLHQYNLKIFENYLDKNRNIEITNRLSNDAMTSFSPVAPLADETEFSDNRLSDSSKEDICKNSKKPAPNESGMKLVIKGWNSSISIQGLDNKSSITFKRRCEANKKGKKNEERKNKPKSEETKPIEKSRKGRWKMLTKSIMLAKSSRFERRGLDERYPKYVLLKDEEEELTKVKENYPKMFVFNEKSSKSKQNLESKPEFSFKKSFKNKTEPIVPSEEILAKTEAVLPQQSRPKAKETMKKQKKPLTERNTKATNLISVQRRKSATFEKKAGPPTPGDSNIVGSSLSHGQIHNEIQGIFEDTLKLLPQGVEVQQLEEDQQPPQKRIIEYCTSMPPQFCEFPCHDPYYCRPPKYVPVYNPPKAHVYKSSNTQTSPSQNKEIITDEQSPSDGEVDLENLPFGILSSFFPRVVIMNTIPDGLGNENQLGLGAKTEKPEDEQRKFQLKTEENLEVQKQDLTLKSKMVQEIVKPELEDFSLCEDRSKKFLILDEDQRTKSQESEGTEYLQYSESPPPENESVERHNPTPPPRYEIKEKEEKALTPIDKFKIEDVNENSENLSLTKIGYKMYDNLTKLSLNHEKKSTKTLEVKGCGCNGNGKKKPPYSITLESNNSVVKVTVPENELNFQIINSERGDIQIGVMSGRKEKGEAEKKIVRREELWHSDEGRGLRSEKNSEAKNRGFQTFKVCLTNDKEVVLSIETNEKSKKEEITKTKSTKEMKVGTDDYDLAGGDFVCALGRNYKNLSPRIGQLLKHLHEKLDTDERERKFLNEKINQKLIDQKFQGGILPGVFLVKHVSPRAPAVKKPAEVSSFRKLKKDTERCERDGQLREYYCEECLATMRIFEDENPSVKSMVDKFETIIQLEGY